MQLYTNIFLVVKPHYFTVSTCTCTYHVHYKMTANHTFFCRLLETRILKIQKHTFHSERKNIKKLSLLSFTNNWFDKRAIPFRCSLNNRLIKINSYFQTIMHISSFRKNDTNRLCIFRRSNKLTQKHFLTK